MQAGTHFSSNATGGFVIDRTDTTLSKLNADGLEWLLAQKPDRAMRRKIEKRLRRMKAQAPNAVAQGREPTGEASPGATGYTAFGRSNE